MPVETAIAVTEPAAVVPPVTFADPSGWHQVLTEAPPSVPWPAFTPTIMPFRFFFA